MNEAEVKEAKLVALALAKIREFCQRSNECRYCPLCNNPGDMEKERCFIDADTPNRWDVDEALYRIGFYAGRREA